uniref:Uncharacterized protein n=1 Tax=Anguilla anguilla TaxID=7936 RepID=A0A0E9PNY6_ANGAN
MLNLVLKCHLPRARDVSWQLTDSGIYASLTCGLLGIVPVNREIK